MKNPDNKHLRIVSTLDRNLMPEHFYPGNYGLMLSNIAVAQSNLIRAGKDSGMPHFIAIIKEIERVYGFKFEIVEPEVR